MQPKPPFDPADVDPVINAPARLAIMTILARGDEVEFSVIGEMLNLTDGNLGAHLRKLEEAGYVKCTKEFRNRKPRTTYRMQTKGRAAFEKHLDTLEKILSNEKSGNAKSRRAG
jgi:DNA-binding transcriptional ArsR family regulator